MSLFHVASSSPTFHVSWIFCSFIFVIMQQQKVENQKTESKEEAAAVQDYDWQNDGLWTGELDFGCRF